MKTGTLIPGKTPLGVLEVICSWEVCAKEIAEELHKPRSLVWRAITLLRSRGLVEDKRPRRWNMVIRPTEAGREALRRYNGGSNVAD
jgi:DNA-binding IclR family transcriptional regulator|tara:strand:- start:386 stop:646 length:261 start_codon:yes stop_codon:yes gene_type:complete